MTKDDFDYAIENTQVILAPEQRIATFGNTSFNFYLISELMDRVDQVRVRNGKIHAERPQILTSEHFTRLMLEGFGEKAWWLIQMLESVPLALWSREWKAAPAEILAASQAGDWKKEFFEAWTRAAIRQKCSRLTTAVVQCRHQRIPAARCPINACARFQQFVQ